MIAVRSSPALKPERHGVLDIAPVWSPADPAQGRPLRLADAIPTIVALQRYQRDQIQRSTEATVGPIGATSIRAPGGAGGGAGRSQT
jgi:hypothetical protein